MSGPGTPALALKVQEALGPLHLAYEAIWPDFNRYAGAPAIGSASDLYVLRPTSRTWKALGPAAVGTRIYTQGPQAVRMVSESRAIGELPAVVQARESVCPPRSDG